MFFECNLPTTAPKYLHYSIVPEYEKTVSGIYRRTEKLDKSLSLAGGMQPEAFQVILSTLFKNELLKYGDVSHFDSMTPVQLSDYAKTVYVRDEPYKRLDFKNCTVVFDTAFGTEGEWLMTRKLGSGGSDSAVPEHTSKWVVEQGLYHDKCGTPIKLDLDGRNPTFDRGHFLEDSVIAEFCKARGAKRIRDTRMFRSNSHPHCIADIDAILEMPDGSLCIFEAKTTKSENQPNWENNKIPPYYMTQMQHYPAVLDDDRIVGTHIGCMFTLDLDIGGIYLGSQFKGSRFITRYIERDKDEEREILDRNEEFWNTYIEQNIIPPRSGNTEKNLKIIRSLSGPADPALPELNLTTDLNRSDVETYLALKQELEEYKTRINGDLDKIKTNLIDLLGQHIEGRVDIDDDSYYEVRYAPTSKIKIDAVKLEAMFPEAYNAVAEHVTEASRTFTIKKKKVKKTKKK